MTKRELLDSEIFASLSDDAEIVFSTDASVERCAPMTHLDVSCVGGRLVIDAMPHWYITENYELLAQKE